MTLDEMDALEAILNATWHEGEECRDCGHKYTDYQHLEHFGTLCKLEEIGCYVVEGFELIEECPAVRRAMEDE